MSANQELTVCDLIGEWGTYQWVLALYGVAYTALASIPVLSGPIWAPDMAHVCQKVTSDGNIQSVSSSDFESNPHQCFEKLDGQNVTQLPCSDYSFDPTQPYLLTNSFDLVCDRQWMRSMVSSSSLLGMLISSVTLGFVSDRYGRMKCMRVASVVGILSNLGAIVAPNYLTLNVCLMLMSFSQIGIVNTLMTLVTEATSPKYRFAAVFEDGFGWALGMMLVPLLNGLTQNFRLMLVLVLVWQIGMTIWYRYGVFESIRWLLSQGKIVRAQDEVMRACRINGTTDGSCELAKKLDDLRLGREHVSSIPVPSPRHSPPAMVGSSRVSPEPMGHKLTETENLSPSLSRRAAKQHPLQESHESRNSQDERDDARRKVFQLLANEECQPPLTTVGLVELSLKSIKREQREEQRKQFFLARMFHSKVYKLTLVMMLVSIMHESSYYGLLVANKFVGGSVDLNYFTGGLSEMLGDLLFMLMFYLCSRRVAISVPTLISAVACLAIAATYQIWPDTLSLEIDFGESKSPVNFLFGEKLQDSAESAMTSYKNSVYNATVTARDITSNLTEADDTAVVALHADEIGSNLLALRDTINVWVMAVGKLANVVASHFALIIVLESYPSELRQTALGFLSFMGRVASIVAPFLFDDTSDEKNVFKSSLLVIGVIGLLVCALIPIFVPDNKRNDLCDRLQDINETNNNHPQAIETNSTP